ncbi:ABC transporter substrate-binding protein [Massilia sp. Root351]|jgi:polar amino acid transport system substrate-binding protein|uniref:substrate-binding periplasmic protein n=1 Tax=Massilia sp. Root351 TaxID=1736522 RepID=UPI001E58FF30|nr:transporter substrate-binding domain-containing protein [Massilia sp. Root351]
MAPEPWPPYIFIDERGGLSGLDYELAQAIMKEAGCTLQVQMALPSLRRQMEFRQGKLDLTLGASETPERRSFARFSLPYRNETVGLFTSPANAARYRSLDGFEAILRQRIMLLTPRGGWYGDSYARALPQLDASGMRNPFGSYELGMRMFKAGRAEVIMGDSAALRHEAQRQGVTLAAVPWVPFRAPAHLMLNAASTSAADLARINAAITRLEQNGTLGAIRARYGLN